MVLLWMEYYLCLLFYKISECTPLWQILHAAGTERSFCDLAKSPLDLTPFTRKIYTLCITIIMKESAIYHLLSISNADNYCYMISIGPFIHLINSNLPFFNVFHLYIIKVRSAVRWEGGENRLQFIGKLYPLFQSSY